MIFIRGADKSYEVCEELLDINSIHDTTTGEDIFKWLKMPLIKRTFDGKNFNYYNYEITNTGKNKGVVALDFADEAYLSALKINFDIRQNLSKSF